MVEAAAVEGFGGVVIDDEKIHANPETAQNMILACEKWGLRAMMRLRAATFERVDYALCLGVQSVLLPRLESLDEVRGLLDAIRFPPTGQRGHGASRSLLFGNESLGRPPGAQVIIETASLLEQVEAVAALPDVEGLDVGLLDLAAALGTESSLQNPVIERAVESVIAAGRGHGKSVCMSVPSLRVGIGWLDRGLTGFVLEPLRLIHQSLLHDIEATSKAGVHA